MGMHTIRVGFLPSEIYFCCTVEIIFLKMGTTEHGAATSSAIEVLNLY